MSDLDEGRGPTVSVSGDGSFPAWDGGRHGANPNGGMWAAGPMHSSSGADPGAQGAFPATHVPASGAGEGHDLEDPQFWSSFNRFDSFFTEAAGDAHLAREEPSSFPDLGLQGPFGDLGLSSAPGGANRTSRGDALPTGPASYDAGPPAVSQDALAQAAARLAAGQQRGGGNPADAALLAALGQHLAQGRAQVPSNPSAAQQAHLSNLILAVSSADARGQPPMSQVPMHRPPTTQAAVSQQQLMHQLMQLQQQQQQQQQQSMHPMNRTPPLPASAPPVYGGAGQPQSVLLSHQIQTLAALQLQFSGVPSGALLQQQGVPGGTLAHEGLPAPHLLNARRQAQAQQAYNPVAFQNSAMGMNGNMSLPQQAMAGIPHRALAPGMLPKPPPMGPGPAARPPDALQAVLGASATLQANGTWAGVPLRSNGGHPALLGLSRPGQPGIGVPGGPPGARRAPGMDRNWSSSTLSSAVDSVTPAPGISPDPSVAGFDVASLRPGEHPNGEYPSRTLFVRNIKSSVENEELVQLFEQFGKIRSMYTACKHRGFVMVSYYDIRAAKAAMKRLQGRVVRRRKIDIHFSIPKDSAYERDMNQGVLVLFNLPASVTKDEVLALCSRFGKVMEVREAPGKPQQRFVEYYDIRDAETAMQGLADAVVGGNAIKVEYSRPSVARRAALPASTPGSGTATPGSAVGAAARGLGAPGVLAAVRQLLSGGGEAFAGEDGRDDAGEALAAHEQAIEALLLSDGSGAAARALERVLVRVRQLQAGETDGDEGRGEERAGAEAQEGAGGMAERGANGVGEERFSEPRGSLLASSAATGARTSRAEGLGAPLMGGEGVAAPADAADGVRRSRTVAEGADRVSLEGVTSLTAAGVPDPFPWISEGRSNILASRRGSVESNVSLNINSRRRGSADSTSSLPAFMQPGPHRASLNAAASAASAAVKAIKKLEDAERKLKQDIKFSLSIERVRGGQDPRTTLMIKNIPNKYTQAMLLDTLDEVVKGRYDFLYLPIDFKNGCNVGYAFINLVAPEDIVPLYEAFHDSKWAHFNSEKVCQLSYARIQGKDALTTHFQNSMLLLQEDKNFRPVLFNSETGEPEEFPIQARPRRGSRSSMDWPKTGRKSGGGPARASADGMGPPGMRREMRRASAEAPAVSSSPPTGPSAAYMSSFFASERHPMLRSPSQTGVTGTTSARKKPPGPVI